MYIYINCEAFSACSLERPKSNKSFPQILGLVKELKIFLHSVDKKQDVFGILPTGFDVWMLKEMYSGTFECPVVIVTSLV